MACRTADGGVFVRPSGAVTATFDARPNRRITGATSLSEGENAGSVSDKDDKSSGRLPCNGWKPETPRGIRNGRKAFRPPARSDAELISDETSPSTSTDEADPSS